ncbi:MAG: bifunctional folylpolyglutamate synthase/dihydrofolate synthase [Alphaproteobacteria bacterium]|nr:bifunctional folylpolyglutamate synthase/dihydrofolate synthase [Alphaproteobacteria bacterium]
MNRQWPITPTSHASLSILERLETLHPKLIDLGLDRTRDLLARLGDPHKHVPPVVHLAGSNGKGSVLAFTRAIMSAAGLAVHAYTSPHLVAFNERIELAGMPIGDAELSALLAEVERVNCGRPITLFEITTCVALLAYSRTRADYLLLETGLGGRLDATNVIDRPHVTAITPVSLDHQDFLGEGLASIAAEKAGILKAGVPAVIGRQEEAALGAIEALGREVGAKLSVAGRDWHVAAGPSYCSPAGEISLGHLSLHGAHQIDNAAQAVAIVQCLGDARITDDAITAGLAGAHWPGRLQHLTDGKLRALVPASWELWLDGGHNPAAGAVLAAVVEAWRQADEADNETPLPLLLIFAMMGNKDAPAFLAPLAAHALGLAAVPVPGQAAGLSAGAAADAARACGIEAWASPSVGQALEGFASRQTEPARVLICGSLYLAGSVLSS